MTRDGLHNPQSFRLATKTDLEPPFDLAFVDLSGKPRTRICKYRHTDNPVGAHTQTGETLETQFGVVKVAFPLGSIYGIIELGLTLSYTSTTMGYSTAVLSD